MCSQSEYNIHAMKHVMLVAEASELRIVYHDHSFWVTVELPSSTLSYIGEGRANHRFGGEVNYEASTVTNTTKAGK